MRVTTVRTLGAAVRAERKAQGMTQADLAARLQVSREWVVRLEQGQPRLEAQRVLDALVVLGIPLELPVGGDAHTRDLPDGGDRSARDPFAYLTEVV